MHVLLALIRILDCPDTGDKDKTGMQELVLVFYTIGNLYCPGRPCPAHGTIFICLSSPPQSHAHTSSSY